MDFIHTVLSFIVALGVLVTIHEYGHFWVARRCGVRVLRFSIGFGKPFFKWQDKHGTEYWLAAIPLGGYVKLLDAREVDVPPEQLHEEFTHKSVWQRIAVFSAGPLVNLFFATLLYWFMFIGGVETVVPVVGQVKQDSVAAQAGLQEGMEIVEVDGHKTQSWQDVTFALIERVGESGTVQLMAKEQGSDIPLAFDLPITEWLNANQEADPIELLGIIPFRPHIPAGIGKVVPGSPAESAGLKEGDLVLSINNQKVDDWYQWVDIIKANPATAMQVVVDRGGQTMTLIVTPDEIKDPNTQQSFGRIGAHAPKVEWPQDMLRTIDYSLLGALSEAWDKTVRYIVLVLQTIGKMAVGKLSLDNISGPITIAQVAGQTASIGLYAFLGLMAYLSISLGVFNLLPIPMLDGGHILMALIEAVRGKPLSERVQQAGLGVGLSLLAAFMLLAFYNDIMRITQ